MPRAERKKKPLRRLLAICLSVAVLGACGGGAGAKNAVEDSTSNNAGSNNAGSNNAGSKNAGSNNAGSNNVEVDNTGIEYAEGYQQRFTSLDFDQGTAAAGIDGILEQNFDQGLDYPIVVLLDLQSIDAEAGTLQVRAGSGLKTQTAGEYEWHPDAAETLYDGILDQASGAVRFETQQFDFIATFVVEDDVNEVVLPIQGLVFDGNLKLDETSGEARLVNGRLEGYMTKEDGDRASVVLLPGGAPISITSLFKTSKLNYDTATGTEVEAGQGDAWLLSASFEATSTTIID